MTAQALGDTAEELFAGDRGTLAMDESIATWLSASCTILTAANRRNALNLRSRTCAPWALGFSFGGAIQQPALELWHGENSGVTMAQQALRHRAKCDQMARRGDSSPAAERTAT